VSASILLIDLSSILHREWHTSGNDPNPDATSMKTVERVRALAGDRRSGVAIALDSPPYLRKQVDPAYKAQRDKENNAVIAHQMALAADTLRADGFPVWGMTGYEADDVIASATRCAFSLVDGVYNGTVTIASADKDLLQLVNDRVSFHSVTSGNSLTPDDVKAKFGVWPHQMRDYLCLVGDSSDNIQGAKGIGQKRAAEILEVFGHLEDAYRALDEGTVVLSPAITKSLQDFGTRLTTVRELVSLKTDVPLPFDEVFRERVPADIAVFGEERAEMEHHESRSPDGDGHSQSAGEVTGEAGRLPDEAQAMNAGRPVGSSRAEVKRDAAGSEPADSHQTAPHAGPEPPRTTNGQASSSQPASAPPRILEPEVLPPPALDPRWQLEPRSMAQAKQVAADLFASRMFSAYGNAPAVLSTIMAGRELGFQTMASLRAIHIIDSKPALSAGAIHSLVLTSGKAKYFRCVERTSERATFETQRGEDPPVSLSFSIEEGRQAWNGKRDDKGEPDAKSWAASGWGRNPADMLVARALTKLARLVYPDITHGLYAPEELG